MSSVTVLPLSPTVVSPSFHPDQLNGAPRPFEDMSIVEIKERAIQQVQRAGRGSSALSLIRSAKGIPLRSDTKVPETSSPQRIHQGYKSHPGVHGHCRFQGRKRSQKRGVLWKEFSEFQQVSRSPLSPHLLCSHHPLFSERVATLCSVRMP